MLKASFVVALVAGVAPCALAQSFSSGSTGADGALSVTTGTCSTTVQLPASGILNYTTVNVASGCDLFFSPNVTNTPVTMLATGAVTIAGYVYVSAPNASTGAPGPGGFYGGAAEQNGGGPGGGILNLTCGGAL